MARSCGARSAIRGDSSGHSWHSIGTESGRRSDRCRRPSVSTTPLIFTGLSVALAFRVGLFNIGAEGQLYLGGLTAVIVGFSLVGLPWFVHLPLAILAGFAGGALWGAIPGILKARTGAHEVIVTIMLNFVAYNLINWSLRTALVQREGRSDPISKIVQESAVHPVAHQRPAGELGHRSGPGRHARRLVAPLPVHQGLRVPGRRVQPARRALRGHQHRVVDGHVDDDCGRPGRPRWHRRHPGRLGQPLPGLLARIRV